MEAPYAVGIGSAFLAFLICEGILFLFVDLLGWVIGMRDKKQKKEEKRKREMKKQKKNAKVSVEQNTAGSSERVESSGAAGGRAWEKEQKQMDDDLMLEEIVELD